MNPNNPSPAWSNPDQGAAAAAQPVITNYTNSNDSNDISGQNGMQQEQHQDPMAFLSQPYSTLDEPISETFMRDLNAVSSKLKVVLTPLSNYNANIQHLYEAVNVNANDSTQSTHEEQQKMLATLKNWDLFGPLLVCLLLSIILSLRAPTSQASAVFAAVFCSMWLGSAVVTVNTKLLGGSISFFQSVCILGYCVFPFCLSAAIILGLSKTFLGHVWLDIIWVIVGFVWATRASVVFIGNFVKKERRFLAVYPVFFYYTLLAWLVLLF